MADDTTDDPRTSHGSEQPDATKQVDSGDASTRASAPGPEPAPPGPDAPRGEDPTPATEQWEPTTTSRHARAYSEIADATTAPVTPPPAEPRPPTAQFSTGQNPAGSGGFTGMQPADAPPTGEHSLPPSGTGVISSAPGRRKRGKFIALGVVGLVVVIVIALVGSELFLRSRATDCLSQQFSSVTGQSTNVSISKKPILLQWISGDFPYVQVDTDDTSATAMRLHMRADGVSQDGDTIRVDSLAGSGSVPFQRVIALSKQGQLADGSGNSTGGTTGTSGADILSGTQITSVTGSAADGTVKVDASVQVAIFPVPVSITMKPVVDQGKVSFKVEQASAFVFGIPADFAQQFVDGFGGSLFGGLTNDIKVTSLKVTDQGVDFAVSGSNIDLNSAATSSGSSGNSCSIT